MTREERKVYNANWKKKTAEKFKIAKEHFANTGEQTIDYLRYLRTLEYQQRSWSRKKGNPTIPVAPKLKKERKSKKEKPVKVLTVKNKAVKKKDGLYWSTEQDQAIVDYQNETDSAKRNEIYEKFLHRPLVMMNESVLHRYFLQGRKMSDDDVEELLSIGLVHGHKCLLSFKSGKGFKSFSYIQTVIRNKYKDIFNPPTNKKLETVNLDDVDIERYEFAYEPVLDEEEENRFTVQGLIFHLESIYGKMHEDNPTYYEIIRTLIQYYKEVGFLHKKFASYYLYKHVKIPYVDVKACLLKYNLSALIQHSKNNINTVEPLKYIQDIFDKMGIREDQHEQYKWIAKKIIQYGEQDKNDKGIRDRDRKKANSRAARQNNRMA